MLGFPVNYLVYSRSSCKVDIMIEEVQPKPVKSRPAAQRFLIYAGVLLVIFWLGFVAMWLRARAASSSLVETEHQLIIVRLHLSRTVNF